MLRLCVFLNVFVVLDCRDAPAATHHEREGDNGGVQLRVHRQAVQDVQEPKVFVHAHGMLPWRRALDNSQVEQFLCF